jgi:hypothetical protein
LQLLQKDSSKRLGTKDCPQGEVSEQLFFRSIDWGALERKELEAPFKPRVVIYLNAKTASPFSDAISFAATLPGCAVL